MPLVMGILNVTPDSFSDGGQFNLLEAAVERAEQMIAAGVDIIDIGGESTRPGAKPLPLQQELDRVMPVVYALRDCGKPLSIDTYKPAVMREALAAGADMINDVKGLFEPGAVEAVAESQCGLCVMHMQQNPETMQVSPYYHDTVCEITTFLQERIAELGKAGIERKRMCIDPGFGFGKTLEHNLTILRNLESIQNAIGLPLLAGLSRKTMIGTITGKSTNARLAGSLAAALVAVANGARIVRVHDVAETVDALKVWHIAMK
ncbi:MAG: folP [Proteobacteria bacterium]|nr:folP [Pseudomonadota bacterium]